MKIAYGIGAIVIVLIIAAVIWHGKGATSMPTTASSTAAVAPSDTTTVTTSATTTTTSAHAQSSATKPAAQHFAVNGNDETADLKTISVAAGTPVSITFGADAGTTYHGGLDFRSSVVNTGTIVPGSTKTITFTAVKSFSFTPYWPSTNIAKPYTIDVVVH